MGFTVLDADQKRCPVIMGCYGIGAGRILAAAIETGHDDDGIIWPVAIAPYTVHLVTIQLDDEIAMALEPLLLALDAAGLDVLVDDRKERPGPKFKDADLIGCPIRLTIGAKSLAENAVEFKLRSAGREKGELVPIDDVVERCLAAASGAQLASCQSSPT
ncbi:MAG: His/Gly/Thr/Pro-type tRNA ligase C-terminal domain-containing protein [Phycisphaerales bacterium]